MSHENAGHYSAKHPPGTTVDASVSKAVRKHAEGGTVSCAAAHGVAKELSVAPSEIGKAIDLLEYRIVECQLGLFGYGPGQNPVRPAEAVPDALAGAIRSALQNDRLPCADSWKLAKRFGMTKRKMAEACEHLGVKIKPCQLGAF